MAYNYVKASFQGHYLLAGGVTYPYTFACWFNADAMSTGLDTLMSYSNFAQAALDADILAVWDSGSGVYKILAATYDASSVAYAQTSSSPSLNTWHHACAVFNSATDRRVYLDGGSKGTNTTSRTPAGQDIFGVAWTWFNSTIALGYDGRMAEMGIWTVALTDDEVAQLALGYSPMFVHPQNLAAYTPLVRDPNGRNGVTWTQFNGPTASPHCRVIYPSSSPWPYKGALTHNLSIVEGLSLGDATLENADFQAAITEGLRVTDSPAEVADFVASLTEGVVLADPSYETIEGDDGRNNWRRLIRRSISSSSRRT